MFYFSVNSRLNSGAYVLYIRDVYSSGPFIYTSNFGPQLVNCIRFRSSLFFRLND